MYLELLHNVVALAKERLSHSSKPPFKRIEYTFDVKPYGWDLPQMVIGRRIPKAEDEKLAIYAELKIDGVCIFKQYCVLKNEQEELDNHKEQLASVMVNELFLFGMNALYLYKMERIKKSPTGT